MRYAKLVLAIILSLSLVVGFTLPVLAKPDKPEPEKVRLPALEVLTGNVTALDPGKTFFMLQQRNKPPVQITVDNQTQYYLMYAPRPMGGPFLPQPQSAEKRPTVAPGKANSPAPPGKALVPAPSGKPQSVPGPGKANVPVTPGRALVPAPSGKPQSVPGPGKANVPVTPGRALVPAPSGKPQSVPAPAMGMPGGVAPMPGRQRTTFDELGVGDRVSVRVARGTTLAKQVIILQPAIGRVNGTVTTINTTDNSTTIQPLQGGSPITVKWNQNTVITIRGAIGVAVGQHARVVYRVRNMTAMTINIVPPPPPPPPPRPTPTPTSGNITPNRRPG